MNEYVKEVIRALEYEIKEDCSDSKLNSKDYYEGRNAGIQVAIMYVKDTYLEYKYKDKNEMVNREQVKETIRDFFKEMVEKKMHKSEKKQMKYINMLLRFNVALQTRIDKLNQNNGWILTKDKLPVLLEAEDCREFIVMIDGAEEATTLLYCYDGNWVDNNEIPYNVVAWHPLPEPCVMRME